MEMKRMPKNSNQARRNAIVVFLITLMHGLRREKLPQPFVNASVNAELYVINSI